MKLVLLLVLLNINSNRIMAQKKHSFKLELAPFFRYDSYPQFSYNWHGRATTDLINLRGTSFGVNLRSQLPLTKTLLLRPGLGYYRNSFNHILKNNNQFGTGNAREIEFPSPVFINYATDKYWYNCIVGNLGVEKHFSIIKKIPTYLGLNYNTYYSFSQYYHLRNNPAGSNDFRNYNSHYFGSSFTIDMGIITQLGHRSIKPYLIVPVYDIWKTDATFQETNSGNRSKWFKSIGVGLSFIF